MTSYFVCILVVFILYFFFGPETKAITTHAFPRRAGYFLEWEITPAQADLLAKHDLVILDMETQARSPAQIKRIRQLNPDIIMLVYITPEDINVGAAANPHGALRRELGSQIADSWYLKNSASDRLSWWPGTELLNVTHKAPLVNGKRFNQVLVDFVANRLLSTGLWDGVFYDNMWDNITYFAGKDIDLNADGRIDVDIDSEWRAGMKFIYNETRRLTDNKYIILGNGTTREYVNEVNGKMIENFLPVSWAPTMNTYAYNFTGSASPRVNIINANMGNDPSYIDYKKMRFGLSSALMQDGYYSFDEGDKNHNQIWWYDEYNVNLGAPTANAKSVQNKTPYQPDVWRRDFSNGLVLVNSTGVQQKVDLGGEYEKIHGTQDTAVNNGSIITQTTLDSYDGLLLMKTFSSVNDVLFCNGDFLRFFGPNGERVRNGFFVFEAGYKGGDKIARIDLDGNGQRDLLVVSKNKLMAWRDDGQPYMKIYPYSVNYQGELRVAIGDLNQDGYLEVYVAPSPGYPAPIKVYTRHGRQMKNDWYPLGEKYSGGYSLAVGDVDKAGKGELLIATGNGVEPRVRIYDYGYNEIFSWLAWEKQFMGGINIASGDVNGEGLDEVVVGAGPGKKPIIRIFDQIGKQLYSEFTAYSSLSNPGIEVQTVDVDFNGVDDIIGMSPGF